MPRIAKAPSVSEKNTKAEIMAAYQELLGEVSSLEPDQFAREEQKVVDTASKETVEKITTDLSQFKLSLNQTIAKLTEHLTEEAERLVMIQKAIAIARKELEQTQKIKVTAGMLYRLVELQKEKEDAFEREMSDKRKAWEGEQRSYEEQVKRNRARNEEEYQYQQELVAKRDADEREEERRVAEREKALEKEAKAQMVKELEDLRKRAVQFPVDLEKSVKEAVVKVMSEAKKEADIARQLAKQESDSEIRLKQMTIDSLENSLKIQSAEMNRLRTQLDEATRQVKDIAVAVIEGPKKESGEKGATTIPTK